MQSSSLGIIGGADGPTSVFLTGNIWPAVAIIALAVIVVLAVIIVKKK